ncbi:MAG: outer membrane beta-barrel protein, partial [Flavobacteriales bacterium]
DEINAKEKDNAITDTDSKKWSLEPSVAPVYFNGFGSGSPIHPEFSSNSKSGNVNLSYGVFVSYEMSKKLSIRSGVHKVDYGYNTNDVKFTSSFAATSKSSLANIDYANNASNLIVVSTSNDKPSANIQGEVSGKTPSKNGSMIQQFGYLEIPLELNYALLDKDFGISLVGGFSSLFLTNNAVLLEADGLNTEIGEANNINDVNFSSNIGFGLNYKFTPNLKLNIEPVFKYQLNTFSNSAGDFKPFSVGIYSGFNFKF